VRTRDRLLAFNAVGVMGFAVQVIALWLLADLAHVPVVLSTALAVELAVLHNFVWHGRWTWADRPAGWRESARRLLRFNLTNGVVSLSVNVALVALLHHLFGLPSLVATAAGVACAAVANYVLGDRVVFSAERRS
jgi:putative flippase GtrA